MSLKLVWSSAFKRDFKKAEKQGKNTEILRSVIILLAEEEELPIKFRNHALVGGWVGCMECHLGPDWLLVYRRDAENLYLVRMGSHSDLF